ncbi:phosphoribosyltransferase [Nocardia sp. NPDC052566]|uniref:phosphoribosyltransferase n=1 Tax=Nocardia sp. NPDC052566 TaxID=3364330 RepID=UPI0037CBF279
MGDAAVPAESPVCQQNSFVDRHDAGRRLAHLLRVFRGPDVVVVGIPRGGVAVASAIADTLRLPLDVLVVDKLRVPHRSMNAFGAISEDDICIVDDVAMHRTLLTPEELAEVERNERDRLGRKVARFRGGRPRTGLRGRTVVLVDDGMKTGITAQAACRASYNSGAVRVVLAVPVAPRRIVHALTYHADKVVCLEMPTELTALPAHYLRFEQLTDNEVADLLRRTPSGQHDCAPGDECGQPGCAC